MRFPARPRPRAGARRRLVARIVLALGCSLASIACQGGGEPDGTGDLVWAIGANEAAPGGLAQGIAALWNERNPTRPKVRVEALPAAADGQRQLMATELNAKLPGLDVLTLDVVWTGEFAVNGWLLDLDDRRSAIEETALAGPLESAEWGGKLWAAPFFSDAAFLYYRKDLVPLPPKTWDELVRVGLDAQRRHGIEPFVGQGAQYEGLVVNYLEYLWGAGGDLLVAGGGGIGFGSEPALRALRFMQDAREGGFYAQGFDAMNEEGSRLAFQSGKALYMRNWPDAYAALKASGVADRFGIAPLPTFDGKGTTSAIGGSNLAVSRFSSEPRTARDFVTFVSTDPAVQRLVAKASHGPTLAPIYDELRNDPVFALLGEVLKDARPRPSTPEWSGISDEIQQSVFPAYTGRRAPEQAVEEIRSFLEATVDESG